MFGVRTLNVGLSWRGTMSETERFEVVFESDGNTWRTQVSKGQTLLEAARQCGAPVHTLCNGIGACVQCRVRVDEDEENLSAPNALEKDRMGNIFHLTRERLACQVCVNGDITVIPIKPRLPKKKKNMRTRKPRRNPS